MRFSSSIYSGISACLFFLGISSSSSNPSSSGFVFFLLRCLAPTCQSWMWRELQELYRFELKFFVCLVRVGFVGRLG